MRKKDDPYKVNHLVEFDIEEFRDVTRNLKKIQDEGVVTEDSVRVLTTIISQLTHVRDKHVDCLINWLKQDYVLDD